MKRVVCLCVPMLMAVYSGVASSDQKCVNIPDDKERLECFDSKHAPKPQKKQLNEWAIQTKTNNLDDSKTAIASLFADEGSGKYGKSIILVARCQSNKTEAFISWGHYLGNDLSYSSDGKAKNVTYRVDSTPAQRGTWGVSTDNMATFVDNPIFFLKSLIDQKRLIVQLTPYNESPVQAVFNIEGARAALKELSETCKWKQ